MPKTQTIINPQLLQPNPSGVGSFTSIVVKTEWTPGPCSTIPIRSTWKDAIGKTLTNRRIAKLMLEGHYGPVAREKQLKRGEFRATKGLIFRCACGSTKDVRYLRYAYLPKPDNYCPICLAQHRNEKDRELELARRVRKTQNAVMKEYV